MKKANLFLSAFTMPFIICAQTWQGDINADWNGRFDGNGLTVLTTNQILLPGICLLEVYAEGHQYEAKVSIMSK
jgi:hypothetical protein